MPKGKAINWTDKELDKLSQVSVEDLAKAQAWAEEDLQSLLTAEADDAER
jgi:hypothetical protein